MLNYSNSLALSLGNLFCGVLVDIDHLFEYFKFRLYNLKPNAVLWAFFKSDFKKIYLFFHSIELVILLWLVVMFFRSNMLLLGVAVGYTQHLLLDNLNNKISSPFSYFLSYKVYHNFNPDKLFDKVKLKKMYEKIKKEGVL